MKKLLYTHACTVVLSIAIPLVSLWFYMAFHHNDHDGIILHIPLLLGFNTVFIFVCGALVDKQYRIAYRVVGFNALVLTLLSGAFMLFVLLFSGFSH